MTTFNMLLIGIFTEGINSVISFPFNIDDALIVDSDEGPSVWLTPCKLV